MKTLAEALKKRIEIKQREAGGYAGAGVSPDMAAEDLERVSVQLSSAALVANYRAIHAQVSHAWMLPMIKANAYGHGAVWAARTLEDEKDLFGFGVATLDEGRELREANAVSPRTRLIVFSGAIPWSGAKGECCERFGLTPVISHWDDFRSFVDGGWAARLPYHLKLNTGMNRLGIGSAHWARLTKELRSEALRAHPPEGIATHLGAAESTDRPETLRQLEQFRDFRRELGDGAGNALFHFANSAAIWNAKHYGVEALSQVVRPGVSLTGVAPWKGAPLRGLQPVMTLKARIYAVHALKQGEALGYGFTYKVREASGERIGILGLGYADGVHRNLSGKLRFRGTISMDLSAVALGAEPLKRGDWFTVFGTGGAFDPWEMASAMGSIPYEVFTSVSARVKRHYS